MCIINRILAMGSFACQIGFHDYSIEIKKSDPFNADDEIGVLLGMITNGWLGGYKYAQLRAKECSRCQVRCDFYCESYDYNFSKKWVKNNGKYLWH